MRLLADSQIPFVEKFFGPHCEIRRFSAPHPSERELSWAEILLIRTITKLSAQEIQHLAWLGSATIGIDHLDLIGLEQYHLPWDHAPGCNAEAVADWVWIQALSWALERGIPWKGKKLGLVGYGNTGQAVARRAAALNMEVIFSDPPRASRGQCPDSLAFSALLAQADWVSFHVPLTQSGAFATRNMMDETAFSRLKPGALLLNCSRGEIVAERALLQARQKLGGLILDVFCDEPLPKLQILQACDRCSPHIAGYSQEGKLKATAMLFQAAARRFSWPVPDYTPSDLLTPAPPIHGQGQPLLEVFEQGYSFAQLSRRLQKGEPFATLRKNYPLRRELQHLISNNHSLPDLLLQLGKPKN